MTEEAKPNVLLLASAETSPSVLYGLYDVLYSVGAVFADMTYGVPGPEALDVRIVAADAEPFRCLGNVRVEPHAGIDEIERADVVIVCDMYTPIYEAPRDRYLREIAWLKRMRDGGALIAAVCSGSLVLAEAGMLDCQEATVHWAYRDLFRRCYPEVKVRSASALCLTAEKDGVITAGGVTAWQDLALHLIAKLCGQQQAVHTAKVFLLSGHEEGQLPYAAMGRRVDTTDAVVSDCQSWIAMNYDVDNPVQRMIERSGLNPRTFSRRFRAATGYQPIEYVQALRIEEAKQMLETGEGSIDEIGQTIGYEDPASFRRLFKRLAGLTPAAYRKKFSSVAAAAQ